MCKTKKRQGWGMGRLERDGEWGEEAGTEWHPESLFPTGPAVQGLELGRELGNPQRAVGKLKT